MEVPIRSAATILSIAGGLAIVLSLALTGCDRLKRSDPAKARAQVKRQQAACGSASASDRLKNAMFDEAIAERTGDQAKLDALADYSVARLQDPVVKGWDPSLDITRCKARFILEVPPGAERGLGGKRQLQADIEYTAQASADGAGFVYHQKGAEPIVEKLAAFNLAGLLYRPPPAIDQQQVQAPEQTSAAEAPSLPQASRTPMGSSTPVVPQSSVPSARPRRLSLERFPERAQVSAEPRSVASMAGRAGNGEATVRAFYGALGAGNGIAATSLVIPEKRSSGPFSPEAISRFYGRLPEPIRLTSVVPLAGSAYRVTYRYAAGRSRCNGSAVVTVTNRGGHDLIRSIRSRSGC